MRKLSCQGCGKLLEKQHGSQRYHDEKCKQAAYRKRKGPDKVRTLAAALAPLVVLAGVDTLYVNAYYADPERLTRAILPLPEEKQAIFEDLQQRAKAARQLIETPWSL